MSVYRERRFTAQNGLTLYFRDYGDPLSKRIPVLCLPGLARNSRDFHRTASRLAPNRRVLCPDYRGRGESEHDPDPNNYVPAVYLNDIRHLLAVTGVHRTIVIGTSVGGLLATAMGAAMPTSVAAVVMNDIGPTIETGGSGRILDYIARDRPQPDWKSATTEFKRIFPHLSLRSDEEWREAVEGTWRPGPDGQLHFDWDPKIVAPLKRGDPVPDLWALFRSLRRVPVLAIRGGRSDLLSQATFDRMAEEHPQLQRLLLPEVGHTPSLSEPETIAAIDPFVDQF